MSLTLYFHPLSSFCHKALIALYENGTPFTPQIVNLMDAKDERAAFKAMWPIGKFPVLRDEASGQTIPESSIVIEYLDRHYPGKTSLIPKDADQALETRLRDRFFDLYLHLPMQKVVGDKLRPPTRRIPTASSRRSAQMQTVARIVEKFMAKKTWIVGEAFTHGRLRGSAGAVLHRHV